MRTKRLEIGSTVFMISELSTNIKSGIIVWNIDRQSIFVNDLEFNSLNVLNDYDYLTNLDDHYNNPAYGASSVLFYTTEEIAKKALKKILIKRKENYEKIADNHKKGYLKMFDLLHSIDTKLKEL